MEEGERFDRQKHIADWRSNEWPGLPSPANAHVFRTARLWWQFDDLEMALDLADLPLPRTRCEAILMRLGMVYNHIRKRADEERRRNA